MVHFIVITIADVKTIYSGNFNNHKFSINWIAYNLSYNHYGVISGWNSGLRPL